MNQKETALYIKRQIKKLNNKIDKLIIEGKSYRKEAHLHSVLRHKLSLIINYNV